jgi:predicted Rdx family selenoprotein
MNSPYWVRRILMREMLLRRGVMAEGLKSQMAIGLAKGLMEPRTEGGRIVMEMDSLTLERKRRGPILMTPRLCREMFREDNLKPGCVRPIRISMDSQTKMRRSEERARLFLTAMEMGALMARRFCQGEIPLMFK